MSDRLMPVTAPRRGRDEPRASTRTRRREDRPSAGASGDRDQAPIDAREAGLDARAGNLPVRRYVPPAAFGALETIARKMGFARVACGPLDGFIKLTKAFR